MKQYKAFLVVLTVLFVLVSGIAGWLFVSENHEKASKQLLVQEINRLPLPSDCTEQSRVYQIGGLNSKSTWHMVYRCDTAQEAAKSTITNGVVARQYTPVKAGDPAILQFQNANFHLQYIFIPTSGSSTNISLLAYRVDQ